MYTSLIRCGIVLSITWLATGCAEEVAPAADSDNLCADASAYLVECTGQTTPLGPHCDQDIAREILAQDCRLLTDPGKADFLRNWLCGLGLMYHCPAPSCEPMEDPAQWTASDCEAYIDREGCDACNYYMCREYTRAESCGDDGYLMGFGRRYCLLFTEYTAPKLSPKGQRWIADVRPCLQSALESIDDDLSCNETRDFAYESHSGCYVGAGFCELPVTDILAILLTVAPQDLGNQPFVTGAQCVKRWINPDTGELTEEGEKAIAQEQLAQ